MGAHLVDFTPCEMRRGLSNSGSVLYRLIEGQQGEAQLVLEQKDKIKNTPVNGAQHQILSSIPKAKE